MVLLKERWPAYISWRSYERNCAQATANRAHHAGVPRGGPSLLAGLLVCGRCGRRMATVCPAGGHGLRYACSREAMNHGGATCQSVSGGCLAALVGGLILQALAPAAVEASLQLAEDVELERTALQRQWRHRLERARYEAERARRQFDAVWSRRTGWSPAPWSGTGSRPCQTAYRWLRRGLLRGRRAETERRQPIWLATADGDEIERLRQLRQAKSPARRLCAPPSPHDGS